MPPSNFEKKIREKRRKLADSILCEMEKGKKMTRKHAAKLLRITEAQLKAIERRIFLKIAVALKRLNQETTT